MTCGNTCVGVASDSLSVEIEVKDESPTNRDSLRAAVWNWRSDGRGTGVLSAKGWVTM